MAHLIRGALRCCGLMSVFGLAHGDGLTEHPFQGVTYVRRSELTPRQVLFHVVLVDLTDPGIRFKLSPAAGTRDTLLQPTLDFLEQEHAQVAINAHFYVPFPALDANVNVVGFAASEGRVYSGFEPQPVLPGYVNQSYAILSDSPALNIDPRNHVQILHHDPNSTDPRQPKEGVAIWNAVSGSSQIVKDGRITIPTYTADADGLYPLNGYSDANPWNRQWRARTALGVANAGRTLVLFAAEQSATSLGLATAEVAEILIQDYGVEQALNLDGGPSTSLALEDPLTHQGRLIAGYGGGGRGNPVGSSLAVFARPAREPHESLQIRSEASNGVRLFWPSTMSEWHLECTVDPIRGPWTACPQSPERRGIGWELFDGPGTESRFYRLRQ